MRKLRKALRDRFNAIFRALAEVRGGNFIELLFVYYIGIAKIKRTEFDRMFDDIPPNVKPKVMTLYDSIVQFGIKKGRKEGREEGRERGREEGQILSKKEAILVGHQNGVPIEILCMQTGYSTEEVQRIIEEAQLD